MATSKRAVGLMVLIYIFSPAPHAQAQKAVTLREAENRMVRGGYLETLQGAYWAARQGEAMVPILSKMLQKNQQYQQELDMATGAFPFNALWALAHIPGEQSLKVLEQYFAATKDRSAALAIQGHKLRQDRQGSQYGVVINDTQLFSRPSEQSQVLQEITSGKQVKILQEKIVNTQEEGPRGGPSAYDRVELLPGGPPGYIQRAGDGFTPFM